MEKKTTTSSKQRNYSELQFDAKAMGSLRQSKVGFNVNESRQILRDTLSSSDDKYDMRLARAYWKTDPLVYKCIKVLQQLANSTINFDSEDDATEIIVRNWVNKAMPEWFRSAWFLEFFRSGMVPAVKTLIPYVPRDYKDNKIPNTGENIEVKFPERVKATKKLLEKSAKAKAEYGSAVSEYNAAIAKGMPEETVAFYREKVAEMQATWTKTFVPGAYTIFDPMKITIKGPVEMSWLREPYLQVGGELLSSLRNPRGYHKEIVDNLPIEIVNQIQQDGIHEIWLSPNICTITYGDKQPYERYPTPIAKHAFDALEIKHKIQEMDAATSDQVKERILLIKMGSDEYPMTDKAQIEAAYDIFSQRVRGDKNSDMYFFWNHLISMEWVQPDATHLNDSKKFEHWNDEIRTAFGVGKIFTGTDGQASGSQGGSILNLKGVVEEVSQAQKLFLEFLRQEIDLFRSSIGLSKQVKVKFQQLNLRDENEFASVIMQLVQNGVIDLKTAVETLGYDFPTIKSRMMETKELREDGLFMPTPSANNLGPSGGIQGPGGGKPRNLPGRSSNNKAQEGKMKPKLRVAAKIAVNPSGDTKLIIDSDVDNEMKAAIASQFNVNVDQIITSEDFEKSYNQTVAFQELKNLSSKETMDAMIESNKKTKELKKEYAKKLNEIRSSNKDKATYATKSVKTKVIAEMIEGFYVDGFKEYATEAAEEDMSIQAVSKRIADDSDLLDSLCLMKYTYDRKISK